MPAAVVHGGTKYAYLDDSNGRSDGEVGMEFPKVMLTEMQSFGGTNEQYSKYDVLGAKQSSLDTIAAIQRINPDVRYHLAFSPRAYQGFNLSSPCSLAMGMPFTSTASTTAGCSVFAGHWLYQAGTTLRAGIGAGDTSIYVANPGTIKAGQYVVIYDAPAGSFNNAEHARVKSVNNSSGQVLLSGRGFKSVARAHGKGAIIAQHDLGQGGGIAENWAYNMSSECPRDSRGFTIGQAMADWLKANYNKNSKGEVVKGVRIDGIYFDADAYFPYIGKVDVDNDLVPDGGMAPNGTNLWGQGLDDFYRMVRDRFPTLTVVAGSRRSRGFDDLNGTQMEGWPVSGGYESPKPEYTGNDGFDSMFQRYNVHMRHHQASPAYVENLSKTPTRTYARASASRPTSNAAFRFAFASTLLDDGYYGQQNHERDPDTWYDEYAVDVTPGSGTYGKAIPSNKANESAVRAHKGWLGRALGVRERLYDSAAFAPAKTLLPNGGFEAGTAGWSGDNLVVNRAAGAAVEGAASLHASKPLRYSASLTSATVRGPKVNLVKGKTYTVVFSAISSKMRDISVRLGSGKGNFLIPDKWTRVVFNFTATNSGSDPLLFNLGQESTDVWIDAVYVFEGDSNLLWREFQNGAVLVNASDRAKTVNLGATWQRILGTQDAVNNGNRVTAVTLLPWDAAVLVRPR